MGRGFLKGDKRVTSLRGGGGKSKRGLGREALKRGVVEDI